MGRALDPERICNGTFGYCFLDGQWQTNINHLDAKVTNGKIEINLSGSKFTVHKTGPLKGTGTMSGFKVTSEMIQRAFSKFSIISKLDDPEAYGHERVRLDYVMVDEITLANWTAGEEVKEEIPFTFEDFELVDPISVT